MPTSRLWSPEVQFELARFEASPLSSNDECALPFTVQGVLMSSVTMTSLPVSVQDGTL